MRLSIITAIFMFSISFVPANAACKEDFFNIQEYAFKDAGDASVEVSFMLQSTSAKPIRMMDAVFGFRDALGGAIGASKLARDVNIAEKGTYSETAAHKADDFERLLTINRADVIPYVCVRGVIYADGTKEEF